MEREGQRIDDALYGLLEKGEKKKATASEARLLLNPDNLAIFTLWQSLRGGLGGGESLYDLWRLSREPGSAAFFEDMLTLLGRLEDLRGVQAWLEEPW